MTQTKGALPCVEGLLVSPSMGIRFSRVGSDPYYASYEKSLSRIKDEVKRQEVRACGRSAWMVVCLQRR